MNGLWAESSGSVGPVTSVLKPKAQSPKPVCVAIDILDEDHSLRLAMRRLATDADLRATLGRAGQEFWGHEHSLERMVEDYERVIGAVPEITPTPYVHEAGDETLEALLAPFGVAKPW